MPLLRRPHSLEGLEPIQLPPLRLEDLDPLLLLMQRRLSDLAQLYNLDQRQLLQRPLEHLSRLPLLPLMQLPLPTQPLLPTLLQTFLALVRLLVEF